MDNTHCGNAQVSSMEDEGLVEDHIQDAGHDLQGKRGKAQRYDRADHRQSEPMLAQPELDSAALTQEVREYPDERQALADDGRQSRPCHAPIQDIDEYRVEDDVCPGPEEHREHRNLGISIGSDEVVQPHAGYAKDRTHQNDPQIAGCIGQHLLTCPEEGEDGGHENLSERKKEQAASAEQEERGEEDFLGLLITLLPQADGEKGRPSDAKEHSQGNEDDHDGESDGDPCDAVRPDGRAVADEDAVNDVVQGVDHHADDGGDAETHQEFENRFCPQGVCVFGRLLHVS
ncbi:hypothetical protein SDC9_93785 [bioreactor metagenome]|uniref:Uncharacterized protein n=1 Tax=bioreactor metagenome TaxID=1076179 RepID=A0A645A1X5_9ZZZZ